MTEKKTAPKKEAPKKPEIAKKKETRNLKTELTREELAVKADELAQATQEVERVDENKKAAVSQFKSQIEELTGRRNRLAGIVSQKAEWRDVDVEMIFDYDTKKVTVTRTDSGEVIQARDMFVEELARRLPLDE